MKRIFIAFLALVLLFGCTTKPVAEIKNITNITQPNITINNSSTLNQKIPVLINETPLILSEVGAGRVSAKEAQDFAKKIVLKYSDNFALWLSGSNIVADGKQREDGVWSVILITPDVRANNESFLSASKAILYTKRSDIRIGLEPGKLLEGLPKIYPLENKYPDSDQIIKQTIEIAPAKFKSDKNLTANLNESVFGLQYYDKYIRVTTMEPKLDMNFVACFDFQGKLKNVRYGDPFGPCTENELTNETQ